MALIDLASWKPKSDKFVLAYRYPVTNLSTNTQLIVYESQEALFFSKGQLMGKFGPGKHTLSTENLPILRSLYGIPFGGKNPFTAEVWIVNKLMPANLRWKLDRMTIHDPDYDTQIPLTANGQYGIRIVDSEKFLINMVGTKDVFTEDDLTSQAQGEFTSKSKSAIMKFMIQNNIGFKKISAYLDDLSSFLRDNIASFWNIYGLEMTKFYVSAIDLDTSTEDGRRVRDAIAQQATMHITGHTWQQEQAFGLANNTVDQMGNMAGNGSGGLVGSIMAMGMLSQMSGGGMGSAMTQPQFNQPSFGGQPMGGAPMGGAQMGGAPVMPQGGGIKMVYCANCSKKHSSAERFCPYCGNEYNPCPRCGADNSKTARKCVSCGQVLQGGPAGNVCPRCGAAVAPGAAFCSSCGNPMASQNPDACPRCGNIMAPGAKFCPVCGNKR